MVQPLANHLETGELMPNNREWALLIWFCVVLVAILSSKSLRGSLGQVLRTLANPKLSIPLGVMLGYVALELWFGYKFSLWRTDLTTDVVLWVSISALALFFKFDEASKTPHFFRRRITATVGITELLQFLTNLFVLSLAAELIVLPLLAALAMLSAAAGGYDHLRSAKKPVDVLLGLISLALLAYALQHMLANWDNIDWDSVLRKFALPIWLTIGLLPFVYLLSLYANYGLAFMRIDFATKDRRARRRAKLALIASLHFRSRDIHAFVGPWYKRIVSASNFAAARHVVSDFQNSRRDAERVAIEEQERFRRYAGSDETDAEGRRLDRREFKETIKALRWLATCQMGWYRNTDKRGHRYRADLLETLSNDFISQGLPLDSGVTMKIAKNGQAWYAWRRTVTGWCFAIGSAGPPPDQWEYDGPEPPRSFPGKDRRWGEKPFSDEVNPNWRP